MSKAKNEVVDLAEAAGIPVKARKGLKLVDVSSDVANTIPTLTDEPAVVAKPVKAPKEPKVVAEKPAKEPKQPKAPKEPKAVAPVIELTHEEKQLQLFDRIPKQVDTGRGEKYVYIDSRELVAGLQAHGFEIAAVITRRTKTEKHCIRMRGTVPIKFGKEVLFPEIVIWNSYDGKKSFAIEFGLWRQVCSNGLTIRIKEFASYYTRHIGEPAQLAMQIANDHAKQVKKLATVPKQMAAVILNDDQKIDLAIKMAENRWKETFTKEDAQALLAVTRPEDDGDNLWTVFNRVQEKLLQGGEFKMSFGKRNATKVAGSTWSEEINAAMFDSAAEYLQVEEAVEVEA